MKLNKYILEISVFICGAVVMIFELVGSRVLGPHLGTSIFVWTALIGIILGSLSIGYYLGGRIADKKASLGNLALVVLISGLTIFLTALIKEPVLVFLRTEIFDIRYSSTLAALVLFCPASIFLGMVSPYAVKLKLESLANSGATVGNLYALSTVGSIVGTFSAGFYLIPAFGTTDLLVILAATLLTLSLLISTRQFLGLRLVLFAIIIVSIFFFDRADKTRIAKGLLEFNTQYSRVQIFDSLDPNTGRGIRVLNLDHDSHSAIFLDNSDLVFDYTKYYHLVRHFNPGFKKALLIGGGAFTFPRNYLNAYPDATIDVVEIDPGLTELAKKYFFLKDDPRLSIYSEDGRTYLNRTDKKYDVIFGDAFKSVHSIPYQLTTQESIQRQYESLNENGLVILNLISAIEGDKGQFLRTEYRTFKSVFPQVLIFPVRDPQDGEKLQNIILVALKSPAKPNLKSDNKDFNIYLKHLWKKDISADLPILTDEHAPVDYYLSQAI